MAIVLIAVLLLLALDSHAQTTCPSPTVTRALRVCWTNATTDVTGAALPSTGPRALARTRVQRARVALSANCSFATVLQTKTVTIPGRTALFTDLSNGKYCFRTRHVSNNGKQSVWSITKSEVIP